MHTSPSSSPLASSRHSPTMHAAFQALVDERTALDACGGMSDGDDDVDAAPYVPPSLASRPRDIPRSNAAAIPSARRNSFATAQHTASGSASSSTVPSWGATSSARTSFGAPASDSRPMSFSQQCMAAAAASAAHAQSNSALSSSIGLSTSSSSHMPHFMASSMPAHSTMHLHMHAQRFATPLPAAVPLAFGEGRSSGRSSPFAEPLGRSHTDAYGHHVRRISPTVPAPVPMHASSHVYASSLLPQLSTPSPPLASISPSHSRPPLPPPSAARLEEVATYESVARWPPHMQAAQHRRNSLHAAQTQQFIHGAAPQKKSPLRCLTADEAQQVTRQQEPEEDDSNGFPFSLSTGGAQRNGEAGYELEFEL